MKLIANPGMKRRLGKILVCLVLGAIIDIAVAWYIAYTVHVAYSEIGNGKLATYFTESPAMSPVRVRRWQRPGALRICVDGNTLSLIVQSGASGKWPPLQDQFPAFARSAVHDNGPFMMEARGWPCLSMWCRLDDLGAAGWGPRGGIVLRRNNPMPSEALPLRPALPGFAINTVFYAAVAWVLASTAVAIPRSVLGKRRIQRGLCPACGYPIGPWGGKTCTECGGPIAR